MATETLIGIHNDIKRLITAITDYQDNEERFKVCERFALSSIKHHRYLSVDGSATREAVRDIATKFTIHGNYRVARRFQELVHSFLSSFDFEQHPQYDLQWSLLTLMLGLASRTHESGLDDFKSTKLEYTLGITNDDSTELTEEIDWAQHLREGQQDFFSDYNTDTDSEFSGDSDRPTLSDEQLDVPALTPDNRVIPVPDTSGYIDKLDSALSREIRSRDWLAANVQHAWWNEPERRKYPVDSTLCDAQLSHVWHDSATENHGEFGTLSEYQVCRELLWMFHAPTDMMVFQGTNESNFSLRPNVSVPSLTTTAFSSVLLPFREYFAMLHGIEQFGIELYSDANNISTKPPLTYEAYNAALQQHLDDLKRDILDIEEALMNQDNTNTFLSVSARLRTRLNTVHILYEISKSVLSDWKIIPNWKCASSLLSRLHFEMQNSYNRDRGNICANLYLSSLTVYLNIIDTWLTEGRLEDWRDEFIITRITNIAPNDTNDRYDTLAVRSSDDCSLRDPVLNFLTEKVQHMGRSIELLISLDRLTDIWTVNIGHNEERTSLVERFLAKLDTEFSKYTPAEAERREEQTPSSTCRVDGSPSTDNPDQDIERNVIRQLSEVNNPFLTKALQDYVPPVLSDKDTTDGAALPPASDLPLTAHRLFRRLNTIPCVLPFRYIFESTLADILLSYDSAGKLVKDIMLNEYKLQYHLTLMRSIYMMEAGHVMSKFNEILFERIESDHAWSNSYVLSSILGEVLSQQWPDSSSRWSVTVRHDHDRTDTPRVLHAVDNITLHYTIGWPVNILLNENTFEKYNEIFRFQLKLKWALWTLNNLRFADLEGPPSYERNKLEQFQIRRLESIRFWLLHAIGSLHAYLSGQVLQNLGFTLQKAFARADTLDTVISVHDEYLSKVHQRCLLTGEFEDIMATISNLIEMCSRVRRRWNDKRLSFATAELDALETSYAKHHAYLALALHNAVQNKDADYLTGISSAFNCSTPWCSIEM